MFGTRDQLREQFIQAWDKARSGQTLEPLEAALAQLIRDHPEYHALLADRDLSARGVEVRFFGGRTRMPAGPALLALRTKAPLYAVDLSFTPDQCVAFLRRIELPSPDEGALDVRTRIVTQRLADAFAAGIAEHPQDWHMLQKLWL